jgi:PBP1b-binding outer membrane lipoprotein LpoB
MKKIKLISMLCFIAIFVSNCSEEEPKKQCEISNTGTIKITNNTSYAITVKVDGSIPSNMGYIAPHDWAKVEVTASNNHSIVINTASGSSANYNWNIQTSVGACLELEHRIIL